MSRMKWNDCLNNDIDEKNCFQVELNECNEDEYRCHNDASCIWKDFLDNDIQFSDYYDRSNEIIIGSAVYYVQPKILPKDHTCWLDWNKFVWNDDIYGTTSFVNNSILYMKKITIKTFNSFTNICFIFK